MMVPWPAFRRIARRPRFLRCQPCLEVLEDRTLPTFITAPSYPAGANPVALVVADVNGDGIPDVAAVNLYAGTVSILLGNGDGSLQAPVSYRTGTESYSVAAGDFNGDGALDLAVTSDAGVSVLLGNGDGTFKPAVYYPVGYFPQSVALGDFNGDGKLDLAVTIDESPGKVAVLLGNGDGTFQAPARYAVGAYPTSVAVGDFNGDGNADLAVADRDQNAVSVLLGNGDGSFRAPVNYAVGDSPSAVAVGDFTGDGKLDLAAANGGSLGSANTVSVLLGNGDGTFRPQVTYTVGSGPASVVVGDFIGDGLQDLAVANAYTGTVSVQLANADGSFRPARHLETGSAPQAVAVGDLNGDGFLDLGAVNEYDGNVTVLVGNGKGSFAAAEAYTVGGVPNSVGVADLNGDGIPDLAVTNSVSAEVLFGNGDGTFQAPRSYAAGTAPDSVAIGDLNGDGVPDLVVADYGERFGAGAGVSVLLNNGDGTFQAPIFYALGPYQQQVALGDFSGDGKLDLVLVSTATVSVLLGNGDGTFQMPQLYSGGPFPTSVAVADLNGDGIPDLATANYDGGRGNTVSVLLGNGNGSFQAPRSYAAGTAPFYLTALDLNGDGIPDLAVADRGSQSSPGALTVLLGNGDGSFQAPQSYAAGYYTDCVAAGDFNGDGIPDLATTAAAYSETVNVFLGDGGGSFQPAQSYLAGVNATFVAAGDFNGDGYADLVMANTQSGGVGPGSAAVSVLVNAADWGGQPPTARGKPRTATAHTVVSLIPVTGPLVTPEPQSTHSPPLISPDLAPNPGSPLPAGDDRTRSASAAAILWPAPGVGFRHVSDAGDTAWADPLADEVAKAAESGGLPAASNRLTIGSADR